MSTRDELRKERRRFTVWLAAAMAAHVAVVVFAVLLQLYYERTHPPVRIVSISLVELPGAPGPAGGPAGGGDLAPAPEEPAVPEPPAPSPEPAQLPAPAPRAKAVPDKPLPPAAVKKAVSPDDPAAKNRRMEDTFARLRQQTANTERQRAASGMANALKNLEKNVAARGGSGPASGSGTGGGGGAAGYGGAAVDPYMSRVNRIIQAKWDATVRRELLGSRNDDGMRVYVAFRILPDGSITMPEFKKPSTSEYMNSSVANVLKLCTPFPAPPKNYGMLGYRFSPGGLVR